MTTSTHLVPVAREGAPTAGIWQQRDGESAKAYAAFQAYCDLAPAQRSLFVVAQKLGYKISESNRQRRNAPSRLKEWSSKWQWVQRAAAWDQELDRVKRDEQRSAVAEMTERHTKVALALLKKALVRMQHLDALELTPALLLRCVDTAVKLERHSRDQATDALEREDPALAADPDRLIQQDLSLIRDIIADPEASRAACDLVAALARARKEDGDPEPSETRESLG